MKNLFIVFIFLFVGTNSFVGVISWNTSVKLTWEDFKAKPDTESDAVALTASGITFGYSVKTKGEQIIDFSTTVESHFYPNKSWYLKSKASSYILNHEQLHFDITELYSRKFRQQLSKLKVNQNIKEQMDDMHIAINKALSETQRRYDEETNHSMNEEKQKEWDAFIAKELNRLDQFKS